MTAFSGTKSLKPFKKIESLKVLIEPRFSGEIRNVPNKKIVELFVLENCALFFLQCSSMPTKKERSVEKTLLHKFVWQLFSKIKRKIVTVSLFTKIANYVCSLTKHEVHQKYFATFVIFFQNGYFQTSSEQLAA